MTLFAESGGVLGIDCECCGRQVAGAFGSYRDLLRYAAGWTPTYCPACRAERGGFAPFDSGARRFDPAFLRRSA